jgi:hypothetical protein
MPTMACMLPLVLLAGAAAGEPEAEPPPTEAQFRRAAATFLASPLSDEGQRAMRTIALFAESSEDVTVVMHMGYLAWMRADKLCKYPAELMMAFAAGNVLAQLDAGVDRNDAYSGMIQVFRVYRGLKAATGGYAVPEIESLMAQHRKGNLWLHLAQIERGDSKTPGT